MGAFTDDIPEVLSPKKTQNNLEKYIEKSKVKKRVFHGSNNPEGIVDDKGFYNYDPDSAEIHWTTDDPDFADRYTSKYMESHGDQGAIFPVHIQLQNPLEVPFDMNTRITPEVWKYAEDLGFSKSDFKEWLLENDMEKPRKAWQVVDSPEFREAAAYRGFDGISAKEDGVNTWGVFAPTQIKSTFNQGTYDVKDPDIGKRDGGPVGFEEGGKVGKLVRLFRAGSLDDPVKRGIFLSESEKVAGQYVDNDKTKKVLAYELSPEAKLRAAENRWGLVKELDPKWDKERLYDKYIKQGMQGNVTPEMRLQAEAERRIKRLLSKEGYSGVQYSGGQHTDQAGEFQIFDSKQLKQAAEPPEEPQAFQKGGKVGSMKDAAEAVLRVLHGSPTKVRLDREKNLDVTTDTSYAMKRARDKMEARGIEGPPMVNKFDIPAAKMLRFEEQYSPEDVAKMKRFYGKLPEGQAMTGEEIYEAAGGKDYVLEGLTRAGGFSGYQRPAGGSGGIGDWYRVTDQEALTRKARGGLAQLQKRYR
jgi:hypothetical protein